METFLLLSPKFEDFGFAFKKSLTANLAHPIANLHKYSDPLNFIKILHICVIF